MDRYVSRLVDSQVNEIFSIFPAIGLVGPRACGKTTTAMQCAPAIVRLDIEREAAMYRLDPDAALRRLSRPAVLDEWQEVPEVLGAVKRFVDATHDPKQFILTGSVRAELDVATWPATGRVTPVRIYPMTMREILGSGATSSTFTERVRQWAFDDISPDTTLDIEHYIDMALRGGYPAVTVEPRAVTMTQTHRQIWLEGYLDQVIHRDAQIVTDIRRPDALRRLVETIALNTAGTPSSTTLSSAAGLDSRTTNSYTGLLQRLMITSEVPAWTTNRLKRLTKAPKIYVDDSALAAAAVKVDTNDVLHDPELLGRLIDTFVAMQIRPETSASAKRINLFHLRNREGQEVDLIMELGPKSVVGVEIKAKAVPTRRDAKHLMWLKDQLGPAFHGGVVFHTGSAVAEIDERIIALPISALWSQ